MPGTEEQLEGSVAGSALKDQRLRRACLGERAWPERRGEARELCFSLQVLFILCLYCFDKKKLRNSCENQK